MLKVKLGDILEIKRGMSLSGEYYSTEGKYIRLTLGNFCYPASGWKYNTSKEDLYFTGYVRDEYILEKGDIITPLTEQVRGLLGNTATIPQSDTYIQSGDIGLVIPNEEKINKRFSYYLLSSKVVKKQLDAGSQQTKIRHTSPDAIKSCVAFIPDVENQKKIARLLDVVNDKIEYNIKINDNLEQQIKTIFTFQFLQNANTEWKQQSLAELSEMYQPKTISGKDLIADGNYFVYGANGIIGKYNQYNHSESEIAVACRGASCGSIQMTLPFSWITGNAMVVKPHSDFPYREYLYYYLLAKNPNYLCSGSAQPQLTRENLTLYSLKVPSTTELNAFESYAEKVRKIIIKNQQENIELSTLRDWLLPMLMNGQATISD